MSHLTKNGSVLLRVTPENMTHCFFFDTLETFIVKFHVPEYVPVVHVLHDLVVARYFVPGGSGCMQVHVRVYCIRVLRNREMQHLSQSIMNTLCIGYS